MDTVSVKSFNFAKRIVKLYKYLKNVKKENILSNQVLRCGTSIGANIAEAEQAQSRADFTSKMNIALKETAETKYWLNLLRETEYITEKESKSILNDCIEIEKCLYVL
ncbi:MAG: four helix bundle protein [Clostridia bacterium]|nr:four helix bundle protein [Clostridia bacterium]